MAGEKEPGEGSLLHPFAGTNRIRYWTPGKNLDWDYPYPEGRFKLPDGSTRNMYYRLIGPGQIEIMERKKRKKFKPVTVITPTMYMEEAGIGVDPTFDYERAWSEYIPN